ncbi:hypothetical protein D7Y15_38050 [Corallococcus sp. AB030]|nr:hypothetical protein D7V77_38365 [Corallococcus sp. CA041A]RKH99970.1 hypothetical protein D7Y15_38050 [Corallococcus sp. AB030]
MLGVIGMGPFEETLFDHGLEVPLRQLVRVVMQLIGKLRREPGPKRGKRHDGLAQGCLSGSGT